MSLWKKILAWFFLFLSAMFGFASTMFSGLSGQFKNCSSSCTQWIPWDLAKCIAGNSICMIVGPFFQATYWGLVLLSVSLFVVAWVIFWRWDS